MKIRKAKIEDLNNLEMISNEQFKVEELQPKFKLILNDSSFQIKLIEDKRHILGFIVIRFLDRNLIDIYSIAIKKEYQKKGYGFKLLNNILKSFTGYKFTLEVSESNEAKKLYTKCGFNIDSIRKRYYGEKNALLMSYYRLLPGSDES
tara:strand:- start:13129 stop:13572 length:444 start_codon:yes stop_codon:yes gene_type:complete